MRFHEAIHDVYLDDLDGFQVLHNARYLLFFERTIGGFWRHLGFGEMVGPNRDPDQMQMVRLNHVEYLRAVTGTGSVRVRVWVEKLGTTSITFGFSLRARDEDVEYARGHRVMVRIDEHTLRPTPWTDEARRRLAPYVAVVQSPPPANQ